MMLLFGLMLVFSLGMAVAEGNTKVVIEDDTIIRGDIDCFNVRLEAQGNENAIGFSIGFDTDLLEYNETKLGQDASGSTLNVNVEQADSGKVGIAVSKSSGQAFSEGIQNILGLCFAAVEGDNSVETEIVFGDQPVAKEVVDTEANVSTAEWEDGNVILQAVEDDEDDEDETDDDDGNETEDEDDLCAKCGNGCILKENLPVTLCTETTEDFECELRSGGCVVDSDDDSDENETEDEIEVMEHTRGAEMRLLQLEKAIKRRVLWGNAVIDRLQEKNISTTELEGILSELDGLTDDVEAEIDALGTKSRNETVREFIRIKMEAKNLTKEFRQTARTLLNASDNSALRMRFSELDRDELEELKNRIRERHREFNSERLADLIEKLGIDGDEIVQKYENGEITLEEALKMVKEEFRNKVDEEKARVRERLRNESEEIEERERDRIEEYSRRGR